MNTNCSRRCFASVYIIIVSCCFIPFPISHSLGSTLEVLLISYLAPQTHNAVRVNYDMVGRINPCGVVVAFSSFLFFSFVYRCHYIMSYSLDNSDWMRNGDYMPTRLDAQQEAGGLLNMYLYHNICCILINDT
jgi:hypothetical protein